MQLSLSSRAAVVSTCLLVAIGALAGTSAGSAPRGLRATAPKLIAHDVSGFSSQRKHVAPKPGPQVYKTYNDTVASDSDSTILNASGDIGRTQYVWALNSTYGVFSRAGSSSLASVSSRNFWAGLPGPDVAGLCSTDPQGEPSVSYDQLADRWVIAEAAYAGGNSPVSPFVECVAVSTSADATGTWSRYVFQVSSTLFPNRPTLGVWSDGYYLSFNQHAADGTWHGAGALALERSKMLAGTAAQSRYFDLQGVTPGLGGMLPANINGPNTPAPVAPYATAPELYLQAHDDPLDNNDRLEVWGFHVDWTAPLTGSSFAPVRNLPLNGGGFVVDSKFSCVQPGTTATLWTACLLQKPPLGQLTTQTLEPLSQAYSDSSDALPQLGGRLQWNQTAGGDQTLTAVETVNDGSAVADPAWYRLTNVGGGGWSVGAKGIYNQSDGNSRFLPSVALDNSGNVGLGFSLTGPGYDTSLAYTEANNGSFTEQLMQLGSTPFTTGATWGRYTTLSLDPVDRCTFWFNGSYQDAQSTANGWLDSFSFPGCVASVTQPPVLTGDPWWSAPLVRETLDVTGHPATFTGATSVTYQWRLCDSRGLNCVDLPGENGLTHTATFTDAIGDRTFRFQETATNANGSSTAVSTATTIVQSIPPQNTARPVISGTAQEGQLLSTTDGLWISSSPKSFTYRWRRCTSGTCANISGATASAYTLTAADVGSTVDVVVSATNTGGGTDANADATAAVTAAPAGSGGGSGGSGGSGGGSGGGGGAPDLTVTGSSSTPTPNVGDNVTFFLAVTDKNLKPASNLYVNIALPSGLQYVSSTSDRGSGCSVVSTTVVKCFLDWLSSDAPSGHLQVVTKVTAAGAQTLTAAATSQQGVASATNSTLAVTVNQGGSSTTTTTTTTSTAGVPSGLNGGGTTKKATKDKVAPSARALQSAGKRGATARLRFRIYDDRGLAKALATVKRNGKMFATAKSGFGPVAYGTTYFLGWHVPATAPKGTYRFCVVAVDHAGNHSRSSCAALAVK